MTQAFDVIVAGDFTFGGDLGLRVAQECRVQAEMGLVTGLLHLGAPHLHRPLSPDLTGLVRRGLAQIVSLTDDVVARLVIVHCPTALDVYPPGLRRLRADRVVLVHDRIPDTGSMARWNGLSFGRMIWAPMNRWVRAGLERLRLPIEMEERDWRPVGLAPLHVPPATVQQKRRLSVGMVLPGHRRRRPGRDPLLDLMPRDGTVEVHRLCADPSLAEGETVPPHWYQYGIGDISADRLVADSDALLHFPAGKSMELPDAAIAAALAAGKLVATDPRFRPHLGPAPIYYAAEEALALVTAAYRDPTERARRHALATQQADLQFPAAAHRERIARLLDLAPEDRRSVAAPQRRNTPPRVLFVPSNGVGLGHVTRLLAIANRSEGRFLPLFATLAQAAAPIESFGYQVEYIPSQSDTQAPLESWDGWFRTELERLIRGYDIDLVVFDGNNPTPGLVHAVLAQPPCRAVWVRRGMGKATASPFLDNARFFDLIIEPGEIAAERDTGATSQRRHEALQVDPIRLLDPGQLLDRVEARQALGIDPERPSVLVQLGSGSHRDVVALVDTVVKCLAGFDGVQTVIAEWENGAASLSLWPDTRVVSGLPLSQYFNAFDFSISAAGYNTFHEVMAFGLPTIFVGNRHEAIDDQVARAQFAQDAGAALELGEDELFQLRSVCEVLFDPRAREVLRENGRKLARPNGAAAAADAIARLLGAA